MDLDLRVCRSEEEIVAKSAKAFIVKVTTLSQFRARIHVGVSSGALIERFLKKLVEIVQAHPQAAQPWSPVHLWCVDEKFLPSSDPQRLSATLKRIILGSCLKDKVTLHLVAGSEQMVLLEAAKEYNQEFMRVFSPTAKLDPRSISLDLAVMSMADDGHFAALFPSHDSLTRRGLVAAEWHSPVPPAQRITLTVPLLRRSRYSWFLVSGQGAAAVLSHVLHGADYREVPASAMNQVGTTWWCDEAATSRVALLGY